MVAATKKTKRETPMELTPMKRVQNQSSKLSPVKQQQKHIKTVTRMQSQHGKSSPAKKRVLSKQLPRHGRALKPDTIFVVCADNLLHGWVAECDLLSGGNEAFYVKVPELRGGLVYDVKIEWSANPNLKEEDPFEPVGTIWQAKQVPPKRQITLIKRFDKTRGYSLDGDKEDA
eukprot:TRINITY_DN24799_c0_g1_i1.p1 TRINITY_DN24799_c0_g1~~TRINITY_DN24799_c0_g1_i1.p1  ORF type:complete len:173 (-),score=26.92 TRINITY_DN24799_c0_g1_i1:160-678(-)